MSFVQDRDLPRTPPTLFIPISNGGFLFAMGFDNLSPWKPSIDPSELSRRRTLPQEDQQTLSLLYSQNITFKHAVIHWYVELPSNDVSSNTDLMNMRYANPDTDWDHPAVKVFRDYYPGVIKTYL